MNQSCGMRLFVIAAAWILWASSGTAQTSPPAQPDILERARRTCDLESNGSKPFVLAGRVHVNAAFVWPFEGSYRLVWLSERKWREDVTTPGPVNRDAPPRLQQRSEVSTIFQILTDDTLWTSEGMMTVAAERAIQTRTLLPAAHLRLRSGETVKHVRDCKLDGRPMKCVSIVGPHGQNRRLWIDAAAATLVREEWAGRPLVTHGLVLPAPTWATEFGNYTRCGDKLVPLSVRELRDGSLVTEFKVQRAALLVDVPSGLWTGLWDPPVNGRSWSWCSDRTPPELVGSEYVEWLRGAPIGGWLHIIIGADGTAKEFIPEEQKLSDSARKKLFDVFAGRFRPAMCGKRPVESELTLYLPR